jgi:hypothetical protein
MKHVHASLVGLFALGLGACATTGPSPQEMKTPTFTDAMAQDFINDIDGAAIHPGSGFRCPADIDGLPRTRAEMNETDGADLFCHYVSDTTRMSLFLTSVPQMMSEKDYFAASYVGMEQAMQQAGFRIDKEATDSCDEAAGATPMMRSLMSQLLPESGDINEDIKTIQLSTASREVLVMTKTDSTSLMIFDEVTPGRWLKLRYTGPSKPALDPEKESTNCAIAIEIFDARETEIRKSAGLISDLERIVLETENPS